MLKNLINEITTTGYVLSKMYGDHEYRGTSELYYSHNKEKLEIICKILQYENDEFSFRYRTYQSEINRYLKFYTDKFGHDEGISKEDFDKFLLNNPIPSYITEFIHAGKMPECYDKNGEAQYHIESINEDNVGFVIDIYYHVSELHGDKDELEKLFNKFTAKQIDEIINEKEKPKQIIKEESKEIITYEPIKEDQIYEEKLENVENIEEGIKEKDIDW